jgi:hypothetical protein
MPLKYCATGRDIGPQICKALGLDSNSISKLVVTIEADKLVVLTIEHRELPIDGDAVGAVLKSYHLVES